ncbi:NADH/NAD ratio-sensing transcriptional regulator Rex [Prauserella alba]|uniref:Redox-sensing transcriptional repressor Rex n=1 Tax=Prauserella alba TaxID=176898 RepID=A0ABN1VDC6_9PSEU|nr:NADH/NAD ratio-sensing transcriptional regulator Rex [Prauserella alba]
MAQRSRRNIASSVRGLARSRRANKSGQNSEPATEGTPATEDGPAGGTSSEDPASTGAEELPVASSEDSASPDGTVSPEDRPVAEAPVSTANTPSTGNGAADGAVSGDGAAAVGGAKKRARSTAAKKGPAKKVLGNGKTAAGKSTGKPAADGEATDDGKPADGKPAADGKTAGRKTTATAASNGKAATPKSAADGKPATTGKAAANGKPAAGAKTNGERTAGTRTTGAKAATAFDDNTPTTELPAVTDGEAPVKAIPEAAVGRMAVYLRVLSSMQEQGSTRVSSEELSAAAGVNSAKLRKDLSYIGSYGTRGVGYEVEVLIGQIERTLGLNKQQRVAVAGIGNLGHALANYGGFPGRGFPVEALFDIDPDLIGVPVGGLPVSHLDDIPEVCAEREISIGVIATPPTAAQTVCDRLVAGGVQCILNFAPVVLQVPEHIEVRKVDLAVELQILSFHVARRADGQVNGQAAGAEATDASSAVVPS